MVDCANNRRGYLKMAESCSP